MVIERRDLAGHARYLPLKVARDKPLHGAAMGRPRSATGAKTLAVRTALRLAPWLAMATMAAFWRRRGAHDHDAGVLSPANWDTIEPNRGRAANYPWRIPPRGWKDIAWRSYHEYGRARLPALAGGVTFYLLLATFPAIASFVSLYGLFSNVQVAEHQFLHLSRVFPSVAIEFVGDQMVRIAAQKQAALSTALVISAALSVWSANAGMKALFDAVNVAYNEHEKRPFVPLTVISYTATLTAIAFITLTTAAALAVPKALHALDIHDIAPWWDPMRWVGILIAATLAFALVYRFGPSRRPARWRWLAPGALFSAVTWMAGSLGFSWYLNRFAHLGVTYGSLGAMIGLMLWMWFSVMIVLMGAELNSEIEHQTACDTTAGEPRPLGQRGAAVADGVGPAFPMSPRQMGESVVGMIGREARGVWKTLSGLVG
jgi:membrane protein